jgi:threonine dehydrogenase-like Zn-dependent dehydrogenase
MKAGGRSRRSGLGCASEPLACVMNAFRRSDIRAGQGVAVVGIGFLGALLTRLCVSAGAEVVALSRRASALRLALALGAREVIPTGDPAEAERRALAVSEHRGYDRVIEAVGLQSTLDLAGRLTREGGRLIIAGYHQDGLRQVDMQLWNWRGLDVINAHERDPKMYLQGMRAAVAAVVAGEIDPFPLFTHTFPLARIGEAFDMLVRRPEGFLKALVKP